MIKGEINSLQDLANDGLERTEGAPRGATTEEEAFAGFPGKRGYRPIHLSDLLARGEDGTEKRESKISFRCSLLYLRKL